MGVLVISRPSYDTEPDVTGVMPQIACRIVVFPEPLGPTRAVVVPVGI